MTRRQWVQLGVLALVAGLGIFFTIRAENTRSTGEQTQKIVKVIQLNTCSHGNLAACRRICSQLEKISNVHCTFDHTFARTQKNKGVVAGGGTRPQGLPGGQRPPTQTISPPSIGGGQTGGGTQPPPSSLPNPNLTPLLQPEHCALQLTQCVGQVLGVMGN